MPEKLSVYIHHQNSFYKLGVETYIEQYCRSQNIDVTVQSSEINEHGLPIRTIISPATYKGMCIYFLPGYKDITQERDFISLSVLLDDNSHVRNRLIHTGTLSKCQAISKLEDLLHLCLSNTSCSTEEKREGISTRVFLSTKEQQVVNYLKNGFSFKEIGILMNVTSKRVYSYKYAIMKRMRFAGKHDFIAWLLNY